MKRILMLLATLVCGVAWAGNPPAGLDDDERELFEECVEERIEDWEEGHKRASYPRLTASDWVAVADNVMAYQNADGGWPKNLDMLSTLRPDSVVAALKPRHRLSTLDNSNVYPQVEYLSAMYTLFGDERHRAAALRGMEYMLSTQYDNGSWRGWDADAATFNDGIIYGVMSLWLEVVYKKEPYKWVDEALHARVEQSWNRGLALILKTQYLQNGVPTAWAQQYDHTTLQPVKARAYELPGLVASESADILMLLMRIRKPSAEVVAAVKHGVAWLEKSKIEGKSVVTVKVPEGLAEDPTIKRDRVVVDDPDAEPMWARYYDLEDNTIFFCTRAGEKVYNLKDVPAERRTGYAWYGVWGNKVLKKYPAWLKKVEAAAKK